MKFKDNGGGDFAQAPIGTHVARCVQVVDIGTQTGEYNGQPNQRRQCVIGFELPTELMPDGNFAGQPFKVSKFYTASLSEKANLRRDLESWRGKPFTAEELHGFDAANLIGKPCLVTVVANDKGKSVIKAVTGLPKGTVVPAQVNASVFFSLDKFDPVVYEGLSKGFKKLIEESPEYTQMFNASSPKASTAPVKGGNALADMDDDIPF